MCAAIPARLASAADLDAIMRARADERRRLEAEQAERRRASMRAAKPAHTSHVIALPRIAVLMKAGSLLGSAKSLAEALGIGERSFRAKLYAERGVSNEDLIAAADALDARAALLVGHSRKLRDEASA